MPAGSCHVMWTRALLPDDLLLEEVDVERAGFAAQVLLGDRPVASTLTGLPVAGIIGRPRFRPRRLLQSRGDRA